MAETITIPIQAKVDEKSIVEATNRFKELQRQLKGMAVDWGNVSRYTTAATTEIQAISDSVVVFSEKLSASTINSVNVLKELGDKLEEAQNRAKDLAEAYETAEDGAKKGIATQMGVAAKAIVDLTQKIHNERTARAKEVKQLEKLVKIQDKYHKRVKEAAQFDVGDLFDDIKDKISSGSLKGIFGDLSSGIKKSIMGSIARGGEMRAAAAGGAGTLGGAAEIAGAAQMMQKAGLAIGAAGIAIGAAVAVFAAFVGLVKAASDHMVELNKTLISGMGFANDLVSDAKGYRAVMDEIREAAINSAGSMLIFGKNSEDTLKIVNAYAKEATGSIIKTRNTMEKLGGSVEGGMQQFVTSAIVFGKALNMESEEVASMMGRFQTEIGYGASQVQGLMYDIVKAAATANMPMNKFMDIFKSVIPDIELYRNRLEELTGTIKLLSKTMSPRDVKQFMEAFSKGFSGTDFRQRLKTVLITGVKNVNQVLESGFESRAAAMAEKFEVSQEEFNEAFKGGEKGMAAMLNKLQAKGKQLSGTDIGEAMKLASYEAARAKGGPLNLATALRGASMGETYQILKKMSQRFGTGFDGLNEHIIAQLGISEQQYLAMRQTKQSMEIWSDQIKKTGMTSSKSLNDGIAKRMMAQDKRLKNNNDALEAFSKLNKEEQEKILFEASEEHEEFLGRQVTVEDLAQEQVTATKSISDKISNVIAFLLEKLYNVLQPMLDFLDNIWVWMVGDESKDRKQMINEMKDWRDAAVKAYENSAAELTKQAAEEKDPKKRNSLQQKANEQSALAEEMRMFGEKVEKAVGSGKTGRELIESTIDSETLRKNWPEIVKMMENMKMSYEERTAFTVAKQNGIDGVNNIDTGLIYSVLGKDENRPMANIMTLGKMQVAAGPSKEAVERAGYRGKTRRAGTEEYVGPNNMVERRESIRRNRLAVGVSDYSDEYGRRYNNYEAAQAAASKTPKTGKASKTPKTGKAPKTPKTSEAPKTPTTIEAPKTPITSEAPKTPITSEASIKAPTSGATAEATKKAASIGEATLEATETTISLLTAIETVTKSINTQAMGISVHIDDLKKFFKGPGVHLNKIKFKNESVEYAFKPMLEDVLENKLSMFLYAMVSFMGEEGAENRKALLKEGDTREKLIKKAVGMSVLAGNSASLIAPAVLAGGAVPNAMKLGVKDFGGSIPVTGMYGLQKGETVLRRGEEVGKSTTINATINVSGANDPRAVAIAVRNELYNLSQKH